ncbi:MAG: ATP-binding cassette domain-containing protein [Magnetococcales bacterium]|nr:ATP-binding cassette domain-containing protein [Magnetococcales bacterium]
MTDEILIRVEGVSKKFCLGLKRSLWYGVVDAGRELLGRDREARLRRDEFWAIEDVSFQVRRGELLGIIGPNGSGKTTMLRLINGLLMPDAGEISIRGRVGALIQLGAGFSNVLTGRENIHINAAVLGIERRELRDCMDEIIDFAQLDEFIDAPVQNYSSGMRARLGFAIAIHMRPDILLVDEVLAVGDMVFRNKALERMYRLANSGVAVVFVSHNLSQVDRLCTHILYLKKGRFQEYGPTARVIGRYVGDNLAGGSTMIHHPGTEVSFMVREVDFRDLVGNVVREVVSGGDVVIRMVIDVCQELVSPLFCFMVEPQGRSFILAYIHQSRDSSVRPNLSVGRHVVETVIEKLPFLPGRYELRLSVSGALESQLLGKVGNLAVLDVVACSGQYIITNDAGYVQLASDWRFRELEPEE